MTDRDYAEYVGLALALATDHRCPICDALAWKSTDAPVDLTFRNTEKPASTVPVVCGGCGYVMLFVLAYLDRKASELKSEGNGH